MTTPTSGTIPRPWVVQVPGDNDLGAGTVFIDTHAYPNGPEPVVAATYPLSEPDAHLIVYAVNHIEQAEADRDELLWLVERANPAWSGNADEWWKRQRAFLAAHPEGAGE